MRHEYATHTAIVKCHASVEWRRLQEMQLLAHTTGIWHDAPHLNAGKLESTGASCTSSTPTLTRSLQQSLSKSSSSRMRCCGTSAAARGTRSAMCLRRRS